MSVYRRFGTGNIQHSLNQHGYLSEVRLHLTATVATTDAFTVSLVSQYSSLYDAVLLSHNMKGVKDLVWHPTRHIWAEKVTASLVPLSTAISWGLELVYEG